MDLNLHSEDRTHHDDPHHVAFAETSLGSPAKVAAPCSVAAPIGSGWYHEAAIEAARQHAIETRCNPYR